MKKPREIGVFSIFSLIIKQFDRVFAGFYLLLFLIFNLSRDYLFHENENYLNTSPNLLLSIFPLIKQREVITAIFPTLSKLGNSKA